MKYNGFQIETFEAGRSLWHARIRRADQEPVIIDGVPFPELEVGFAWSHPEAAIADAKTRIDYLNLRSADFVPRRGTRPRRIQGQAARCGTIQLPGMRRRPESPAHHLGPGGIGILDHALHQLRRHSSGYRQGFGPLAISRGVSLDLRVGAISTSQSPLKWLHPSRRIAHAMLLRMRSRSGEVSDPHGEERVSSASRTVGPQTLLQSFERTGKRCQSRLSRQRPA